MWRLRTLLLPLLLCMICAVVYSHNTLQEQRNGLQDGGTYGLVDNLTYTYSGNQLTKISDSVEDPSYVGAFNFRDGADNGTEYTYDANGNMTSDKNKGITSITYNAINQPEKITFAGGKTTEYVYGYDGTKLQTIHKTQQPQTSTTTTYRKNLIYENGALKQMLVDDGYVTFSGTTPIYHFYIQDHLGNNRVVARADGTVEQVNHYYPFGGLMADICTGSDIQPYKYNGKELDRMHGLDTYDYGARQHNAATGRWDRIDLLAEENPEVSPYAYCGDNPVNNIDPDGKKVRPDEKGYAIILNTLSDAEKEYVVLTDENIIDSDKMSQCNSQSNNFLALKTLVESEYMINVTTLSETQYVKNGEMFFENFSPVEVDAEFKDVNFTSPVGNTTGECGNLGVTYMRTNDGRGKSPIDNNSVHININPTLSRIGAAETFSHEGYGHAYIYVNTDGNREKAVHHYVRGGSE